MGSRWILQEVLEITVNSDQQVSILQKDVEIFARKILFCCLGHTLHEWTSYTSFQAIFRFFHEKRQEIERSER